MYKKRAAILQTGDEADRAFVAKVYRDHRRLMYWAAWRACRAPQELDDIVSDACAALLCKVSDLRAFGSSVLCAYIISVVRNTAFAHMRALRRTDSLSEEELDAAESDDTPPLERMVESEAARELVGAIRRLPDREKRLLSMRYVDELSIREMAQALHVRESTVRSALSRAREHARQIANRNGEGEDNG